jgi:formamidopyrimidine-DNA glycosylase
VAGGHGYPLVEELPNKFTHVVIGFRDGSKLYFNDMRQFGYMMVVKRKVLDSMLDDYGVEPLADEFTVEELRRVLSKRKAALKTVLLNQKLIAGIGSIYADEACFMAGVRPTRRAEKVTLAEAKRLRRAIVDVLKKAIDKRGTTFGSFRDGLGGEGNFVRYLKVYRREGEVCKKCKRGEIKRVKVGGRSAHFCPVCQK